MSGSRRFEPARLAAAMHNVQVMVPVKSLARAAVVVLALALTTAACGTSKSPVATTTPKIGADQTDVPVPPGVQLTKYGTVLKFGQSANIAYTANQTRKTILELKVLSATQGSIADLSSYTLDQQTLQSRPYYVQVYVKNIGMGDVGRTPIPLFLVDNHNTLISASSFTNSFTKCPSTALPLTFAPQDSRTACLVYLAPDHGTMTGVSFRAVQEYAPILWQGTVTIPKAPVAKSKKTKKAP